MALRDSEWVIWWTMHSRDEEMSCVILADDVPLARYLERYEGSRETGFSHALTFTKCGPAGILSVNRSRRAFRATDGAVSSAEMVDRGRILIEEGGLSEEIVARLPADEPEALPGSTG